MRRATRRIRVGVLAFAVGVTSCENRLVRVCTSIGCDDGLIVQLEGELPANYTVSLDVPGNAAPWVVECTTESPCGEMLDFPDFTPDVVRVTVESGAETKDEEFVVAYETLHPNGPDCPPECRRGTVVFQW